MASLPSLRILSIAILGLLAHHCMAEPGVLSLTLEKREITNTSALPILRKRAGTPQTPVFNVEQATYYVVNTTVGTPAQDLTLQIATGTSDTWVPNVNLQQCQAGQCIYGTFDLTKSSSFASDTSGGKFLITYEDGTKLQGDYFDDTLTTGGVVLKQLIMGLVTNATTTEILKSGLLGLSYDTDESLYSGNHTMYPSFMTQMVRQGVINTNAFSLWLNSGDSKQGNIVFGGVDTTKYSGDLVVLPLQPDYTGGISSFTVLFSGLEIKGDGGTTVYSDNSSAPVVLEIGTTSTLLPSDMFDAIATGLGVVNSSDFGYLVRCNYSNSQGVFYFKFGQANSPVISVQISEFIFPIQGASILPTFPDGSASCRLAIDVSPPGFPVVFGDSFLRSAYLVYNIAGNSIAIGQTKFNVSSSSIVPITTANNIPGATATALGVGVTTAISAQTTFMQTGIWNLGTAVASATASNSAGPSSSKGNIGAIVGGTIGGLCVIGILALGGVYLCVRHRRNAGNQATPQDLPATTVSKGTPKESLASSPTVQGHYSPVQGEHHFYGPGSPSAFAPVSYPEVVPAEYSESMPAFTPYYPAHGITELPVGETMIQPQQYVPDTQPEQPAGTPVIHHLLNSQNGTPETAS